jgi:outer membrane murein-binding lipoprotein Lpp
MTPQQEFAVRMSEQAAKTEQARATQEAQALAATSKKGR